MVFRLPDEAALDELIKRSHVREVRGRYSAREEPKPKPEVKPAPAPKPPRVRKPRVSKLEQEMAIRIHESGLPAPVRQYRYFEDRKFTGDFVWPDRRVALEVDGGAHKAPASFDTSHERSYLLMVTGWSVLHVGRSEVKSGLALEWITNVLMRTVPPAWAQPFSEADHQIRQAYERQRREEQS